MGYASRFDEVDKYCKAHRAGHSLNGIYWNDRGIAVMMQGNRDSAIACYERSNKEFVLAKDTSRAGDVSINIGFFRYNGERKLWTAMLDDEMSLTLRKGTTAKDIMQLNPMFQQCHQSFIVNLSHVRLISNTQVRLHKPFALYSIPIGRTFLRPFIERFRLV